MRKKVYPLNRKHFEKLSKFGKEIIRICKELRINPIIYGSYMLFYYVQDNKLKVNDLDFYIKEKDFGRLIKTLERNKIKYKYSKEWHTLKVLKKDLKIEFDSIDYWYKGSKKFINLVFNGIEIKTLSLKDLKMIYKKASEKSKDDPEGNSKKYELLKKYSE